MSQSKIIVALDYPDANAALNMADQLDPSRCRLKIGKELFTRSGPEIVKTLQQKGFDIFLDLKYHDIPNTVAKACAAAADLGVWMMNVHTLGGPAMMSAAREAIGSHHDAPLLIGVTLLTSMEQQTFEAIAELGSQFQLVTPGIRPAGSAKGDQHRIMTPAQAIQAGSHYLVIGRPITAAADPMQKLIEIENELR